MRVGVVTLFPELFGPFAQTSFVKKALLGGQLALHLEPLRQHGLGRHLSIDDTPYGGGSGMVMRVDCVVSALESARAALGGTAHAVLLTPQGERFSQAKARELADREALTLVCGRYEGFDERVRGFVDEELSLGDFVLSGGEIAALSVLDAVVRLLPGALGDHDSAASDSFYEEELLSAPSYTRPPEYRGHGVPPVLLSGDHAQIAAWRRAEAERLTRERRPELWNDAG
jgi:tRNA (guanine37-N1)-methyltransferase